MNVMLPVTYTDQDQIGLYYPLFVQEIGKGYESAKIKLDPKNPMRRTSTPRRKSSSCWRP